MNIKKFLLPVVIMSSFLLTSCSSDEEEVDPYAGRHPDFFKREHFFIRKNFDYYKANEKGYEGVERNELEMDQHRPQVRVEDYGNKVIISFPDHPHKKNHYWAWIEVIDKNGTEFYEELDEPKEDVKNFEFTVVPEKPFRHRIRVRAFCHVHGEFMDYIDLPNMEKKSIID